MPPVNHKLIFGAVIASLFFTYAGAITCYQCSGTNSTVPFQCNEWLSDYDLLPESCDHVHNAKYCIKHIGRFEANSIQCYQCSSATLMDCSDGLIHSGGLQPESCDHVFEAQYCVKSFGLDGGIGAKRYCSSLDLGNYCDYVRQPGDILEYRSCVFTCTGDGCNTASSLKPVSFALITSFLTILLLRR